MKNERGITLTSLVITIILLILIATISISSGVVTIKNAKYNKAKNEMELMQANVNLWNKEYYNKKTQTEKDNYLNNIGSKVENNNSDINEEALKKTGKALGVNTTNENELYSYFDGYRFLSSSDLKEKLGFDDSYEFLVDIIDKKVILLNGIEYDGKVYFTPEDFDIVSVNAKEPVTSIDFKIGKNDDFEIEIYDLIFKDKEGENTGKTVNINNFKVQYKNNSKQNANWIDTTKDLTKYINKYNNKIVYKFPIPQGESGEYSVKVTTLDNVAEKVLKIRINAEINIASTSETTPYLPEGSTIINNNLNTGLTIKDKNQNEWVWIEVPKFITSGCTSDSSIEEKLQEYVQNGVLNGNDIKSSRNGFTDEWYDGCGLSIDEYNTQKSAMLRSIKKYGGFYIGKYEAGYMVGEGGSIRTQKTNPLNPAVIKKDAYPYNYVTCSEANGLASTFNNGLDENSTASLLFGIQWDLVLKHLNVKGEIMQDNLVRNSTSWGNYKNATFLLDSGSWAKSNSLAEWFRYNDTSKDDSNYVIDGQKVAGTNGETNSGQVILTTGASDRNKVMNIYDFAGNLWELTLEKSSNETMPVTVRGGCFENGIESNTNNNPIAEAPASIRKEEKKSSEIISNPDDPEKPGIGFRVTFYQNNIGE